MTNTITLTDEQLADLNAGKSITIDPPRHDEKPVEKWEPKGGVTVTVTATEDDVTREQYDRAAKRLRQYARLLAWRDEHCPDYVEPELGEFDYGVCWDWVAREWEAYSTSGRALLEVALPQWAAQQLAHDLNTGKVEL